MRRNKVDAESDDNYKGFEIIVLPVYHSKKFYAMIKNTNGAIVRETKEGTEKEVIQYAKNWIDKMIYWKTLNPFEDETTRGEPGEGPSGLPQDDD
jgi:hypothetical protein